MYYSSPKKHNNIFKIFNIYQYFTCSTACLLLCKIPRIMIKNFNPIYVQLLSSLCITGHRSHVLPNIFWYCCISQCRFKELSVYILVFHELYLRIFRYDYEKFCHFSNETETRLIIFFPVLNVKWCFVQPHATCHIPFACLVYLQSTDYIISRDQRKSKSDTN